MASVMELEGWGESRPLCSFLFGYIGNGSEGTRIVTVEYLVLYCFVVLGTNLFARLCVWVKYSYRPIRE
mgnify:CR=1 FL=1